MTTATGTTIAALHATGQVEGTVTLTATITAIDRRHSGAGHPWVELTVTDASSETLPVLVFPKTYNQIHQHLAEHASVRITGLINQTNTRTEIYASDIQPDT